MGHLDTPTARPDAQVAADAPPRAQCACKAAQPVSESLSFVLLRNRRKLQQFSRCKSREWSGTGLFCMRV